MLKTIGGKVPVRTLKDYLSQERTLLIPPWQREYSWKTGDGQQVATLLSDLLAFAKDQSATEYLIGSVILCETDSNSARSELLLIDGQQRTLTLSLFLMCARRYIKKNNLVNGNKTQDTTFMTESLECLNERPFGTFTPKVSMNQGKANEILAEIYDWGEATSDIGEDIFLRADAQTLTQRNLSEVAKYIYQEFEKEAWENDKLISWINKIIHNVKLIELELDNQREAISVYDRINDRGMSLSSADLIKNILFQKVDDDLFEEISENWQSMVENLNECKKLARLQDPKYLLRALAAKEKGEKIVYEELVRFWTSRFDDSNSRTSPRDFAQDLVVSSKNLSDLARNVSSVHGDMPEIFLAAELGSVQHFPALLAGSFIKDKAVFKRLADQVNARTLLYILGKERTQTFESLVPPWTKAVSDCGPDATIENLNSVFSEHAKPSSELFESVEIQFSKWDYRNSSDRKKIRAVLAYLSAHLDHQVNRELKVQDAMRTRKQKGQKYGWELDHVMPQDFENEMPFQGIGNLVLLTPEDNREASNSEPSLKNVWYNQCQLVLTKSLSDLSQLTAAHRNKIEGLFKELDVDSEKMSLAHWNTESVSERTKFYFKYFKSIINSYLD